MLVSISSPQKWAWGVRSCRPHGDNSSRKENWKAVAVLAKGNPTVSPHSV